MHCRSQITGVEIDSITARLARQLYPDADIRHQPFEESKLVDGYYDVAISNIPFGDYQPFDPRFKKWKFVIHDYFFAAALEKIRPGGLLLLATYSRNPPSILSSVPREYVASKADFLGAIRLPNDAFKKNASFGRRMAPIKSALLATYSRNPPSILSSVPREVTNRSKPPGLIFSNAAAKNALPSPRLPRSCLHSLSEDPQRGLLIIFQACRFTGMFH